MFRWWLAVALCFAPSLSRADEAAPLWAKVGPWEIRVDTSIGHGCFMVASFDDGTDMRVGLDPLHHYSYFWLGNEKWKSLQSGATYLIDVAFDGDKPRVWRAGGLDVGGQTFLMLPFDNLEAWKSLSKGSVLHISYLGRSVTDLPLKGAATAVATIFSCQKEFGFDHNAPDDPVPGVLSKGQSQSNGQ